MPQKALHLVQATPRVDQEAGVRMPEVVDADISQAGFGSGRIPSAEDRHIGLERLWVSKHPLTLLARHRLEQSDNAIGHGYEPWLAQLGGVDAPMPALKVKVLPTGIQHLALSGTRQDQHGHDALKHLVVRLLKLGIQALGFVRAEVTLFLVVLLHQGGASGRVLGDTRRFPLDGTRKHVAQQNEQAVARPRGVSGAVLGHEADEVCLGDLVKIALAPDGFNMLSEQAFVALP